MKRTTIMLILSFKILTVLAFDIEIDDKYYNIIGEDRVELTFKDTLYNSYEKDVIIPSSVSYNGNEYKVVKIGEFSFALSKNLYSVEIPESVTAIGNSAFFNCENLTSIILPDSVEIISKYAFALCKNISAISIPSKVKNIDEATFLACENLESVELPEELNNIGSIAFLNCHKLKSITLPRKLDNLGACAIFTNCKNLESIKVLSERPPIINPMLIEDINLKRCKLLVPVGTKKFYEEVDTWKNFGSIEEF
ncbi:MAG: leucine-rich repeat domain-containing protein [Prevotellaceae bacterium]|nr:leucine-rich repeat domain-containing protein [Prevotellaceae bacterium]